MYCWSIHPDYTCWLMQGVPPVNRIFYDWYIYKPQQCVNRCDFKIAISFTIHSVYQNKPKIYKKSSKTEVTLACQTHQTPHIGRPQRMPDISTIDVKIIPIGANDLLIKAQMGVFVIRYTKLITAIDEYIPRLSHADGTCRYMILTIAPC